MVMIKGGDKRAQAAANGKKVGRPAKARVVLTASPDRAAEVLAMDGSPDHQRKCKCEICSARKKEQKCECITMEGGGVLECKYCRTRAEHFICHCEICGWWEGLTSTDRRLRIDTRRYLTDRRNGKPVQPVSHEDTKPREINVNIRRIGS